MHAISSILLTHLSNRLILNSGSSLSLSCPSSRSLTATVRQYSYLNSIPSASSLLIRRSTIHRPSAFSHCRKILSTLLLSGNVEVDLDPNTPYTHHPARFPQNLSSDRLYIGPEFTLDYLFDNPSDSSSSHLRLFRKSGTTDRIAARDSYI